MRLFIERAVAVKPDFQATNENAPAIAGICERVDGLPLAIELAAARVKLFSPAALLGRLEKSLSALGGGTRDAPARQQTLRGAILWSYDMLDDGSRRLLARCQRSWLHAAERTIVLGRCTRDHLVTHYDLPAERIDVIPNWSDQRHPPPPPGARHLRQIDTMLISHTADDGRNRRRMPVARTCNWQLATGNFGLRPLIHMRLTRPSINIEPAQHRSDIHSRPGLDEYLRHPPRSRIRHRG